jgi:hypothetical protein
MRPEVPARAPEPAPGNAPALPERPEPARPGSADDAAPAQGAPIAPAPPPTAELPAHDDALRGELARRLVAERPGWNLYESPSWFLATPVDDPLLVEGARARLEATRSLLLQELPPRPDGVPRVKPLVLLHPSGEAYRAAGAPPGSTGYWDPKARELVAHDAGPRRAEVTWPALQHMAVHAHLDAELGLDATPPWLLFGVGARLEGRRLRELRSGGRELLPRPLAEEAELLSSALAGEPAPAAGELLALDREAFLAPGGPGGSPYRRLRLASALVAFLEDPEPCGVAAVDAVREGFPRRYLEALQGGAAAAEALTAALGELPLEALEAAWRTWLVTRLGLEAPTRSR